VIVLSRARKPTRWIAASLAALAQACGSPSDRQGAAPGPLASPPEPARPASSAPPPAADAAPAAVLAPSALQVCIPAPALVADQGCAFGGGAASAPVACADLSPVGSPEVGVLSILVSPAPYDFARRLGIPSMQTIVDAGAPGADAMLQMYRTFEGPRFEPTGNGRQVKLEARGLMLGGVVHWATLDSPRGSFTTVVVRQIPLHDSPLADADRKAVEAWNLATIATCLDGRLWPAATP
jgi:hypothetical protein